MFDFIRKNKLCAVILILFIVIPFFIQMHWWPFYQISAFLTPRNHGDWLQFWGSYLGIIPSGLIAYLVASYQINQDRKMSERALLMTKLPFFDINSGPSGRLSFDKEGTGYNTEIRMETAEGKIPVKSVKVIGLDTNGQTYIESYNYFYPSQTKTWFIKLTGKNDACTGLINVKLWCRLLDGTKVFYTWGDGTTDTHYFQTVNSDIWEPYIDGENIYFDFNKDEANKEFNH